VKVFCCTFARNNDSGQDSDRLQDRKEFVISYPSQTLSRLCVVGIMPD